MAQPSEPEGPPWQVAESLCLAAAVARQGDNSWGVVSRLVNGHIEKTARTLELSQPIFRSFRECSRKYYELVEENPRAARAAAESAGRKPGLPDPANEAIFDRLRTHRVQQLRESIEGKDNLIKRIQKDIEEIQSGGRDAELMADAQSKKETGAEEMAALPPGWDMTSATGLMSPVACLPPDKAAEHAKKVAAINATMPPPSPDFSAPSPALGYAEPQSPYLPPSRELSQSETIQLLQKVLRSITSSKNAPLFRRPVLKEEAPDYDLFIKQRMDLSLVGKRIKDKVTTTKEQFIADLDLMFNNAFSYNQPGSEVYKMAQGLKEYSFRELEKQWAAATQMPATPMSSSGFHTHLGSSGHRGIRQRNPQSLGDSYGDETPPVTPRFSDADYTPESFSTPSTPGAPPTPNFSEDGSRRKRSSGGDMRRSSDEGYEPKSKRHKKPNPLYL